MASMRRRPDCCLFTILACMVVSLIFSVHASLLGDTLTVGQVMKDWDFLESSNKCFRLLFFSPESSNNLRYLGIQIMNFRDWTNGGGQDKMVWVANRDKPLRGTLNISHDGNLMLTDYNGTFITINAEEQAVPSNDTSATLFDTGNLVLRAGKHIVWQSFDYPSDTWLPGMKLGLFKSSRGQPQHRFLTSQVSPQVPTLGAFTLGVDPNNTKQLVIWQRGVLYWRSGMWNGYNFSYFPNTYDEFNFSYFSNESQSYFTFTRTDNDFPSWIDIDSSGNVRIFETEDNGWSLGGTYNCDDSQVQEYSSNLGCVAPNPSNCTAGDVFIKKSGSTNSWGTNNNVSQGISDCKEICRQDCACTAYASALSDGSGCQFFYGEYSDSPEYIFYIRNSSTANIVVSHLVMSATAPKRRKATVSRSTFNSVRFQSAKQSKSFHKSFESRTVHLERNVQPDTFESIHIRPLFNPLGGDLVLSFSGRQNLDWVREFYCNMEGIRDFEPSFTTWVRSKSISVTPALIRQLLKVERVFPEHYPFPVPDRPTCHFDTVAQALCGVSRHWPKGDLIKQFELLPEFRLLNLIVCANIIVTTHSSEIKQDQGFILYCIAHHMSFDLATLIIKKMIGVHGNKQLGLPYGCLINRLLSDLEVPVLADDEFGFPSRPFTKKTVSQSRAHVKGESSRAGTSAGTAADLVEEAEFDAAAAGGAEDAVPPRAFHDQLQHFEEAMTQRLNFLDARFDAFDGRLGQLEQSAIQTTTQLAHIISLLQLQQPPPPPAA